MSSVNSVSMAQALHAVLEASQLDAERVEACAVHAETAGIPLERALFEADCLPEAVYLELTAQRYGMAYAPALRESLTNGGWSAESALTVPLAWLKKHLAVPLRDASGKLVLALCRPAAWLLTRELELLFGESLERPVLTSEAEIVGIINQVFGESADLSVNTMLDEDIGYDAESDAIEDLLDDTSDAPFIKLVNMILAQAVRAGASDIHIEPYREISQVRFRLDGVLYERHTLAKMHHAAIVSRIKVMAKLNIAEKRLPQDGRIAISLGGREVGLRVSTLPTSFGERVVLRLLEKTERVLSLAELGLHADDLTLLRRLVSLSHGMILVTGPTGSGKTTSLYAVLQEIASPNRNILTIEDPVEYELAGVGQIQVNHKIGLGFAEGLRSIVRQDPDVILVGEIRDAETAAIAVQSALTGHLVFSTLHTNDAPSAVTRLFDMGVEPFLLSSVLRGVVAQRLVRMLCPHCRRPYTPSAEDAAMLDEALFGMAGDVTALSVYEAVGCPHCMDTGYRGRMALYEIMALDDALKRLIVDRADANALRACALAAGMRGLRFDGLRKVAAGRTTLTEVSRVTNEY